MEIISTAFSLRLSKAGVRSPRKVYNCECFGVQFDFGCYLTSLMGSSMEKNREAGRVRVVSSSQSLPIE